LPLLPRAAIFKTGVGQFCALRVGQSCALSSNSAPPCRSRPGFSHLNGCQANHSAHWSTF